MSDTAGAFIAKVGTVNSGKGECTLVMPGTTTETKKKYKYNKHMNAYSGLRVVVLPVSGSYVIVCSIVG